MREYGSNKKGSTAGYWFVSIIILAILAVIAWVLFMPGGNTTSLKMSDVVSSPDYITLEDMSEKEKEDELKNLKVTIGEVVLGEARESMKYIVLERPASVPVTADDTWLGWDIFKKTKTITFSGTAYYSVDLSKVTDENVDVDTDRKLVTITVPSAQFDHIDIDASKTGFTKTNNGLLRFGESKLTSEQHTILWEKAKIELTNSLKNKDGIREANFSAKESLAKLFSTVVTSVAPDYSVVINVK